MNNTSIPSAVAPPSSLDAQKNAAAALSAALTARGVPHAFIGGFAWAMLGSARPTDDIDVLVERDLARLDALRVELVQADTRFAQSAIKLFYIGVGGPVMISQRARC
jgi:hypothetical protein